MVDGIEDAFRRQYGGRGRSVQPLALKMILRTARVRLAERKPLGDCEGLSVQASLQPSTRSPVQDEFVDATGEVGVGPPAGHMFADHCPA